MCRVFAEVSNSSISYERPRDRAMTFRLIKSANQRTYLNTKGYVRSRETSRLFYQAIYLCSWLALNFHSC